jgi:hypothetical protein
MRKGFSNCFRGLATAQPGSERGPPEVAIAEPRKARFFAEQKCALIILGKEMHYKLESRMVRTLVLITEITECMRVTASGVARGRDDLRNSENQGAFFRVAFR